MSFYGLNPDYTEAAMTAFLKRGLLALALFSCLLASSCTKEPEAPLRVGTNFRAGYEPFYIANELDFFGDNAVRLVEYPSATEVIRAFRSGSLEAAAITLDEALLLAQYKRDFRVILVLDYSNGADALLASESVPGLSQLKGKRVGAEVSAMGAYILARALDKAGLAPTDITLVPLAVDEHERAFLNNATDAVVTSEPVRSNLLSKGARILFDSSDMPGEIIDVLVVKESFLEKDPSRVNGLIRGWFRGVEYISRSPDDAVRRMKARLRLKDDEIKKTLKLIYFPPRDENINMLGNSLPSSAHMLEDVMLENRLISCRVDVSSLIEDGPLGELE